MISGKAFEHRWFGYVVDHSKKRRQEIMQGASLLDIELEAAIVWARHQMGWKGDNPPTIPARALRTVMQRILYKGEIDNPKNVIEVWPTIGTAVDYRYGIDGVVFISNTILTRGMYLHFDLTIVPNKVRRPGIYLITPQDTHETTVCFHKEDSVMPDPPRTVQLMIEKTVKAMGDVADGVSRMQKEPPQS